MERFIELLENIIWSNVLIIILVLSGLYYSFKTKFLQVRLLKTMVKLLFKGKSSQTGVSSFQAFAMALSGRIGIGNIAGVATAIGFGGPGAIFWMWVIAFIGAATAFVEATLGQIYKEVKDGEYRGGPAFYIEKGLGVRWFALIFAFSMLIAGAIFLPGIQSNSMAVGLRHAFAVDPAYTAVGVAVLLGFVIFGGVKRIGKTAEIVVPFMALGYVLVAVIIMVMNIGEVPGVFKLIVNSAIGKDATFGGIIGSAIAWGVKRGLYSNEAGQGSAPHAASAAEVKHPAQQGLVQAFSVYIDTLFVCSATTFMILISGKYNVQVDGGEYLHHGLAGYEAGIEYTQQAVNHYFPHFGNGFVAVALLFFAFTTIMNYYYMAETNLTYVFRDKMNKTALFSLRILLLGVVVFGAVTDPGQVWDLGDIGVGLTAWINLIAIFLLRKPALNALKDFEKQMKKVATPIFRPSKLGIKNAELWEEINSGEEE